MVYVEVRQPVACSSGLCGPDEIANIMPMSYDGETGTNTHLDWTVAVLCSNSSVHWEVWHGTQHSGAEHLNKTGWIRTAQCACSSICSLVGTCLQPSARGLLNDFIMVWHFVG